MKAPVLLVDIDGLRPDVLQMALDSGQVPTLGEMLPETRTLSVPVLSTAPSITFCAQASLVTGEPPSKHQIVGNQYFDRFGAHSGGRPRHYAFDVGDMLAVDDAVRVFSHGLAESQLSEPTLFTRAGERGLTSVVAGHMYGAGATRWLKPDVIKMGRFIKGKGMVRLEAAAYDGHVVDQLIADIEEHGLADISMVYFLGVDFTSHHEGPEAQMKALVEIVEPHLARLWPVVKGADENVRVVLFSDHGQIEVVADDAHSLRIGFPFDDAWGRFFKALGLDVHDYPGEAPDCEAVVSLNGGMASIDIRGK
ncbi:MAG TPA: alkaline phosphatase family protein, partial [Anaerolineae bacterium]|nr:alkaline phosphatase family protein [Anaerolineae bacterium]